MKRGDEILGYNSESEMEKATRLAKENTNAAAATVLSNLENSAGEAKRLLRESANARSRALDVLKETGRTAEAALAASSGQELQERLTLAGNERSHGRIATIMDENLADVALSKPTALLETEPHNFVMQERARKMAVQMVSDIATGKAKPFSR